MAPGPLTFHLFPLSFRMRPCPWFYSLSLFIFRQSVNVKSRAWEIIQRQWTRGTVTNLCHGHCDLCRQFVTHEPGDLCDITEKNTAGDQRWAPEAVGFCPADGAGRLVSLDVPFFFREHLCASDMGNTGGGFLIEITSDKSGERGVSSPGTLGFEFLFSQYGRRLAVRARNRQHKSAVTLVRRNE